MNRRTLFHSVLVFFFLLLLPLFVPRFYVYTLATIFVMGLVAMSLNLVLGYGGIYQLHHAVFYGVGAYSIALILSKTHLPVWVAFLAGPLAASALSFLMGLICIRLSRLYFGMLQISLGSLVWAIAVKWYTFTGGDNGIHGIPVPGILGSINGAYYFVLMVAAVSALAMYLIVKSPFGATLQAVRDNPARSEAVGVNVVHLQLAGLVLAGFFSGIAGDLFVVLEGSVFPDLMFWTLSLEIMIMCLLGGMYTFMGPVLGAAIIIILRITVGSLTEYWTFVMGIVLMLLIFFLPQGVLGYIEERWRTRREGTARKELTHASG
jgi:branched-chain amino acid transport system permease protein